jgi:hypothetical protein
MFTYVEAAYQQLAVRIRADGKGRHVGHERD